MELIRHAARRHLSTISGFLFIVALSAAEMSADVDPSSAPARPEEIKMPLVTLAVALAALFAYMTTIPGLLLYYAGMVRRKNVLSVMMQCMALTFLMSLVWITWGYSLAFGKSHPLDGLGPARMLVPIGMEAPAATQLMHCFYHGAWFVLATCLLCGAVVERMRLVPLLLFGILWGTFVFCPICRWTNHPNDVTGTGPFAGALDFAGAQAVHIGAGVSALICAIVVGRRLGFGMDDMRPHNLTYTTAGAAVIWLGALGVHFGSALARGLPAEAINALVFTHLSISAAALTWAGLEWIQRRQASILGIASGTVAGFAGAAAAAGIVDSWLGVIFGTLAGAAASAACGPLKQYFRYDDSLDVFGVHAVAGATGLILAAVFANSASYGDVTAAKMSVRMTGAVLGLALTAGYAAIVSLLILKLLDLLLGLRVLQEAEMRGLDLSEHGQEGYIFN